MQFEVELIKILQQMSGGFSDALFLGITQFGAEIAFLAVAVVLYWCIDKAYAYKFFNVYILGVAVTNFIKLGFKRPRPFDSYRILSIGDPETTYSFPSGHTQSIASISTMLTMRYGRKYRAIPIVCIALTLLVMISRMYLGQHYLSDVFCGLTLGIFSALVFCAVLSLFGEKEELFLIPNIILSLILISVLSALGMLSTPSGGDILKGLGAFNAFGIGYILEKRYIKYDVKAYRIWWTVVLRVVVGLAVAIAVQQGFKLFLPQSIPMLYCYFRYFVMAAWAALAAPCLFGALRI